MTKPWDLGDNYAISLAFRFYSGFHGGLRQGLDVENFIKPVLDAVAAGLFCDTETDPREIKKWGFNDSNFNTLFIHRLPNALESKEEGVAVNVSSE